MLFRVTSSSDRQAGKHQHFAEEVPLSGDHAHSSRIWWTQSWAKKDLQLLSVECPCCQGNTFVGSKDADQAL